MFMAVVANIGTGSMEVLQLTLERDTRAVCLEFLSECSEVCRPCSSWRRSRYSGRAAMADKFCHYEEIEGQLQDRLQCQQGRNR